VASLLFVKIAGLTWSLSNEIFEVYASARCTIKVLSYFICCSLRGLSTASDRLENFIVEEAEVIIRHHPTSIPISKLNLT